LELTTALGRIEGENDRLASELDAGRRRGQYLVGRVDQVEGDNW
jgi:hypothetical protein